MAKNSPIPVPPEGMALLAWLAENPQAVRQMVEAVNLLISLQVEVAAANSTRGSQQSIVTSPDRFLLPIPLKLQAAIADASGGGTVDTQARAAINTLLAYLRKTPMLPS